MPLRHLCILPLRSICGALDLFRTTGVSAQQRQFLDIVSSGAEHILTLVEDMMAAGTEDGAPDDGSAETQFRLTPVRVDPLRTPTPFPSEAAGPHSAPVACSSRSGCAHHTLSARDLPTSPHFALSCSVTSKG